MNYPSHVPVSVSTPSGSIHVSLPNVKGAASYFKGKRFLNDRSVCQEATQAHIRAFKPSHIRNDQTYARGSKAGQSQRRIRRVTVRPRRSSSSMVMFRQFSP